MEGFSESCSIPKQGRDQPKSTTTKPTLKPKTKTTIVKSKPTVVKLVPIVKSETEPKGKEKLFSNDPIIDNEEEEELDKAELKRRKAHEAEMDEHQCIIRKAEAKEKDEREAQVTLESKKLVFPA